ncbi:hypothetical protein GCM10010872_02000 [Dyella flava]|nr:hypothetical protein GCM10010872_02000 [Dyella flava]
MSRALIGVDRQGIGRGIDHQIDLGISQCPTWRTSELRRTIEHPAHLDITLQVAGQRERNMSPTNRRDVGFAGTQNNLHRIRDGTGGELRLYILEAYAG